MFKVDGHNEPMNVKKGLPPIDDGSDNKMMHPG